MKETLKVIGKESNVTEGHAHVKPLMRTLTSSADDDDDTFETH